MKTILKDLTKEELQLLKGTVIVRMASIKGLAPKKYEKLNIILEKLIRIRL